MIRVHELDSPQPEQPAIGRCSRLPRCRERAAGAGKAGRTAEEVPDAGFAKFSRAPEPGLRDEPLEFEWRRSAPSSLSHPAGPRSLDDQRGTPARDDSPRLTILVR